MRKKPKRTEKGEKMAEKTTPQPGKEQDGFVVWDQQGLVVMWPDKHSSRFSWEALRHICLCAECREHCAGQETVPQILFDLSESK